MDFKNQELIADFKDETKIVLTTFGGVWWEILVLFNWKPFGLPIKKV